MLTSLSIKNYALIDSLFVEFHNGFSTITGETGAGKSILLGGLALILGKRAELSSIKNKEKKCVIEGEFLISKYDLEPFFKKHDLDFEKHTIIRREILPNGKSRAFVNDTPTTLAVLSSLSDKLIDVHSQHQTLQLADTQFQFLIVDALAENTTYLKSYQKGLHIYKKLQKELQQLINTQQEATQQHEYHSFLLKELEEANFKPDEQRFLEQTLEKLNHIEEIKLHLTEAQQLATADEIGVANLLQRYATIIEKLSRFSKEFESLSERINSVKIEFDDIVYELENNNELISYSPQEIEKYNERLQLLYDLLKKHQAANIDELLEKQQQLVVKVGYVENASEIIAAKNAEITVVENQLNSLAQSIHDTRKKAMPTLIKRLKDLLKMLEMPATSFKINIVKTDAFFTNGKDQLEFLIATNKGSTYKSVKKVASGGEMSRIMLAVKAILSNHLNLPTIIFDEIDTGVSGEVSNRIASVMVKMSQNMQVLAITHLPQIAAKGNYHYKVYKTVENHQTATNIKLLSETERIDEIAEMLSGKNITEAAFNHAKQLLNQ